MSGEVADLGATMAAPKFRWLRFGLRAMFVVFTMFAVWLGWTASIVHQRKALLALLRKDGCYSIADRAHAPQAPQAPFAASYSMMDVYAAKAVGHATDYSFHQPTAPFTVPKLRRWIGDEPRWLIAYRPGPDISEVQRVFPETLILLVEPNGKSRRR